MLVEVIFFNILYGTSTLLTSNITLILIYIQMLGNLRETNSSSDFPFQIFCILCSAQNRTVTTIPVQTLNTEKVLTLNVVNKREGSIRKTFALSDYFVLQSVHKTVTSDQGFRKMEQKYFFLTSNCDCTGHICTKKKITLDSIFNSGKTTILGNFQKLYIVTLRVNLMQGQQSGRLSSCSPILQFPCC